MTGMRVLELVSSTGFYGAEKMIVELSKELRAAGLDVAVAGLARPGAPRLGIIEKAAEEGIPAHEVICRGRFDMTTVMLLRSYVSRHQVDVVHSHGYKANFYAFWIRTRKTKLCATCHNWLGSSLKMRSYKWLDKLILKHFGRIVAVSEPLKKELLADGMPAKRMTVIPNGIAVEDAAPAPAGIKEACGVADEEKMLVAVGRLCEEKGYSVLIDAIALLARRDARVKGVVVGDGPLREELEARVRSKGAEGRICFAGVRRDVPRVLAAADVFVMPSLKEGTPMALLEAMAAARPVVASAVGAIPEVIEDGTSGILVPPGDAAALAAAVESLLNSGERAAAMGRRARERVAARYSARQMAEKYREVFRSL